ncbi:Decaprenyl-diphosphate synthase subunit 1 [Chamberlinius hualienensis]
MAGVVGGWMHAPCTLNKLHHLRVLNNLTHWKTFSAVSRLFGHRTLSHSADSFTKSQCLYCEPCASPHTTHFNPFCNYLLSSRPVLHLNIRRSLWSSSISLQSPHIYETGSLPTAQAAVDQSKSVEDDLRQLFIDIRKELEAENSDLRSLSHYYFDGQGKAIRPLILTLMARAINFHVLGNDGYISKSQRKLAMILEMLHTATLVHDDVIDGSDQRRGKPSVNILWDHKKAILGGDYLVSVLIGMLIQLGSDDVVLCITEVIHDLVIGELMQLGSKDGEDERFKHYLTKTFKKTASLLAFGCKSMAILSGANEALQETAFQYGRNVGIAFQLVDDLLDFISNTETLGKPAVADLKLGLATAPVLFACEKFPELNAMIMRRFSQPGDVEAAHNAVLKSEGLAQTKFLAEQHSREAIRCLQQLSSSPEQQALFKISDKIINRNK